MTTTTTALAVTALVLSALAAAACSPASGPEASPPAATAPGTAAAQGPVKVADPPGAFEVRYYVLDEGCPYCRDLRYLILGGGQHPSADPPLAKVYEGKVRFVFRPAFDEHFDPSPETKLLGFGGSAHGFAGVAPDGTVRFVLPGHHQTRGDLILAIDEMLR